MGDCSYVVGPELRDGRSVFLCPVCDESRLEGPALDDRECTRAWLQGQLLVGDRRNKGRTCYCFETDPFERDSEASDEARRFFHYRAIALKLGGGGRRVDLPRCVRKQIEGLYGESRTGFIADASEEQAASSQAGSQAGSQELPQDL